MWWWSTTGVAELGPPGGDHTQDFERDLLEGEAGRVDDDRVLGLQQRAVAAVAVLVIALGDRVGDAVQWVDA